MNVMAVCLLSHLSASIFVPNCLSLFISPPRCIFSACLYFNLSLASPCLSQFVFKQDVRMSFLAKELLNIFNKLPCFFPPFVVIDFCGYKVMISVERECSGVHSGAQSSAAASLPRRYL